MSEHYKTLGFSSGVKRNTILRHKEYPELRIRVVSDETSELEVHYEKGKKIKYQNLDLCDVGIKKELGSPNLYAKDKYGILKKDKNGDYIPNKKGWNNLGVFGKSGKFHSIHKAWENGRMSLSEYVEKVEE